MLLEIHVQAVRKKMSQMLVFRFQAVMRSEIKVAKSDELAPRKAAIVCKVPVP